MLKKLFFTLLCTALLTVSAWAAPFLAVDTDANHAEYIVELDGVEFGPAIAIEDRGEDGMVIFDLDGLIAPGNIYTIRCKGLNAWGDESEWSVPLDFAVSGSGTVTERQDPDAPTVLRILSE